jgi:TonB family protein
MASINQPTVRSTDAAPASGIRLLVELEPRLPEVLSNARDALSLGRPPRSPWELEFSSPDARHNVLIRTGMRWAGLCQSAVLHVLVIAFMWAVTNAWVSQEAALRRRLVANTTLTYYHVSPYLPALETDEQRASAARPGNPALAPQHIVSLPRVPDNSRQTIITPPKLKLESDLRLPNLVAWTPNPGPVPVAGNVHAKLTLPVLPPDVIPPPVNTPRTTRRLPDIQQISPLPPAPEAANLGSRLQRPQQPASEVVAPPVSVDVARPLGAVNIGQLEPTVVAPKLPAPSQQTITTLGLSRPAAGAGLAAQPAGPPVSASAAQQLGLGSPAGQMIALSVNPDIPTGPINVPGGNRRGTFAATPDGRRDAAATPDIMGGGPENGPGGLGRAKGGPEGISIGHGGPVPSGGPVVAGTATPAATPDFKSLPNLMALARRPDLRDIPHTTPSARRPEITAEEAAVFGPKRFYSMMLNMPNLNSVSGTCIIRFAELNNSGMRGELIAPVATEKVDPAYPAALMHDGVQGTITLYAVIRSDGSVGEVRVLSGIDDRLDQYAREALVRWRFRPATKNGNAVALEAVIRIPFQARKPRL